jgi:hypothetical protein
VGKHSLEELPHEELDRERQLQEAKAHHLASGRRTSAAAREMLYHTLVSHRMKLLAQGAELALRLGDILAGWSGSTDNWATSNDPSSGARGRTCTTTAQLMRSADASTSMSGSLFPSSPNCSRGQSSIMPVSKPRCTTSRFTSCGPPRRRHQQSFLVEPRRIELLTSTLQR